MATSWPRSVFDLLMKAAADSLLELGRDPKWLGAPAQLGITAVLHTWTRELTFHPHVHCIVTGGGLADDGSRWVSAPSEFLFPVRVLGALFRGKVLDGLARARRDGKLRLAAEDQGRAAARRTDALHRTAWIVYAKRPFGGPEQVYRYLGRYTHRVAISNPRLVSATDETVTFRTRGDQTATLPPLVFLSRFLQHVLPHGFVKIRHHGLLASGNVTTRLERARVLLGGDNSQRDDPPTDQNCETDERWPELLAAVAAVDVTLCPSCGAHAVQCGPLPSPHSPGARAPPECCGMTGAQTLNDALALVAVSCTRDLVFAAILPAMPAFTAVRGPARCQVLLHLTPARIPTGPKASSFARASAPRSP